MTFSFEALLETAHDLANAASSVTLQHFRCHSTADNKGGSDFDPVTVADRGAEEAMRDIISRRFPEHGIAGEEFGNTKEGADFVWFLDPIDGTRSFILGLPLWGTLIGLQHEGKPILGIMDQPFTGERFWSGEQSAWYRGPNGLTPCKTRPCSDLAQAYLAATTPDMFRGEDETRLQRASQGGAHAPVRRRLLSLLHAGARPHRHRRRSQAEAVRHRSADPHCRKGRRRRHPMGGGDSAGGRYIACGDPGLLDAALAHLGR